MAISRGSWEKKWRRRKMAPRSEVARGERLKREKLKIG
jgi:hypothetical protein